VLLGAGPIAAPTATPNTSMTAASAAVTRGDRDRSTPGRVRSAARSGVCRAPSAEDAVKAEGGAASSPSDVEVSDVLAMCAAVDLRPGRSAQTRVPHKNTNVDQLYEHMLCSRPRVVK
jgi:hypothetical protein